MQPSQPVQIRQTPSQPIPYNNQYQNKNNYNNQYQMNAVKSSSTQPLCASSATSFGTIPMQASPSMQTVGSSEVGLSQQSSQSLIQSQSFPVLYNNTKFMVNPICLCQTCRKFEQLIQPFLNKNQQFLDLHLEILGNDFTNRNVNNFLRLCQNLSTDVQDSEMEEICEIAKLFQADQIYNTGLAFVQRQIDPEFNVPDSKYNGSDGKTYLVIDGETNAIHHTNLNDLDFENSNNESQNKTNSQNINQNINFTNNNIDTNNQNSNSANQICQQNNDNISGKSVTNSITSNSTISQQSNQNLHISSYGDNNENQPSNSCCSTENPSSIKQTQSNMTSNQTKTVIYQIRVEGHVFKCPIYRFCANGSVMFTAKLKDCDIYIGKGNEIHINKMRETHVAHIFQTDGDHNLIRLKDFQFRLQYVNSGKPGHISIDVKFPCGDRELRWTPKTPKYDMETNQYYLDFSGQYHHEPIKSRRNIVLENEKGNPTFIVRKVKNHVYEVECLPIIDPLIVFTISLSDIIGPSPYYDYFA